MRTTEHKSRPASHTGPLLMYATTVAQSVRFLRGQVKYMIDHGFHVAVLSSPGPTLDSIAQMEGATTIAIRMSRRPSPISDLISLGRVCRVIRKLRPAVVCAGTPKAGLLVILAATLFGVPVRIYVIRGLPMSTMHGWRRFVLSLAERATCLLAHRVICVSRSVCDLSVGAGLVPATKTIVLHHGSSNGVDASDRYNPDLFTTDKVREMRDGLLLPPNAQVIGFVGRLVRDKGVVDLHNAWSLVRSTHPNAHLLMVGCFETADSIPNEVRASLEADSRVRLVTNGRDAAPYYALMDVLVHPSHREGFPNVVLEASAMQVPVVTTDAVGCIDSVQDGVTGTVVPVGDTHRLASAVQMYLGSDVLRRKHGFAGRQRTLRDFVTEDIWRALLHTVRASLTGSTPA